MSWRNRSPNAIAAIPSAFARSQAAPIRLSYSSLGHGHVRSIGHSGNPARAACASASSRRTACMATRPAVALNAVNRPATSRSGLRRSTCRDQALSLPVLQESRTRAFATLSDFPELERSVGRERAEAVHFALVENFVGQDFGKDCSRREFNEMARDHLRSIERPTRGHPGMGLHFTMLAVRDGIDRNQHYALENYSFTFSRERFSSMKDLISSAMASSFCHCS